MQRSDERERTDSGTGLDDGVGTRPRGRAESDSASGGRLGGVRRRVGGLFSVRAFLLALVLCVVGLFVGGAVPIVGGLTRFLGLFAAAFVLGVVGSRRRYAEVGLAATLASGLGFLLATFGTLTMPFLVRILARWGFDARGLGFAGAGLAGVGAGAGLVVALAGYYFGRDLRDGLTREV